MSDVVAQVERGMSWKMRLESVSESVNDHLRLRNDYLMAENRILRHQIDGRVQLTDSKRKALAELSAELGTRALEAIATVARPDTILAWNRTFADQQVDTSKPPQSVGRPRLGKAIEDLVVCMARENRTWGYDRIQGALTHLGYTISDRAVGHILKRHGISPGPERHRTVTWREFIRSHLDMWLATDFFNREIWSWCGLLVSCLLSFLHWGRHHIRSVSYQTRQDRRSFVRQALEWSAHGCRWGGFVKALARSQALQCSESVRGHMASACVFCEERRPGSPAMGQVVVLSVVYPKPIRDGPTRRHPGLRGQLRDDHRKAA
jgi:putative transposase